MGYIESEILTDMLENDDLSDFQKVLVRTVLGIILVFTALFYIHMLINFFQ